MKKVYRNQNTFYLCSVIKQIITIKTNKMTTIQITPSAFVRVSKHSNGFYTQLIYNNGNNGDRIYIYKTEKAALKKANQLKDDY